MAEKIIDLCRQIVQPGDRIVAAVSGGADSICLAHALKEVCPPRSAQLFVVHVNHQLRGENSEEDARFVCRWAAEAGLPRALIRIEVPRLGGESAQNSARKARYLALAQACRRFGANKLVTAHHADDQVETFLLNLLRGSGSRGLQGIPQERSFDGILLLRPLLDVTRREVEDYCRKNGLHWRTDASNNSLNYQRNRIRHHLLPLLREYNPRIDAVLLNTINNLRLDQEVLADLTSQALAEVETPSPLPFAPRALSLSRLSKFPLGLQHRMVLELLPLDSQSQHVEAVLALQNAATGKSVDLPGGKKAYRLHDSIALGGSPSGKSPQEVSVPVPGQGRWGPYTIRVSRGEFPGSRYFWLPAGIQDIIVGPRRPGDYFHPRGGGKKLKSYMIDKKIPRWLRDTYPVLRAGNEIIWVAGLAFDTRFTQAAPGRSKIYIQIEKEEEKAMEKNIGEILLDQKTIQDKVAELAATLDRDYAGKKPLLICVLKGALMFMADLTRAMKINLELDFMAVSSYGVSTKSSGVVRILKDLETSIEGRHVIIVEDIIDSGLTLKYLLQNLMSRKPASLKICTLLDKPSRRQVDLKPDYCGFAIEDKFVVGYGLDFAEEYRNLPFIGVLKPEAYQ